MVNDVSIIETIDAPVPKVSAIIITLKEKERGQSINDLIQSLSYQTHSPLEIITVTNVRPAGKARNIGAKSVTGEYLLFLDDDAILTSNEIIDELVKTILSHPEAGIVGAATLSPDQLTWFSRQYYKEFPRGKFIPRDNVIESDMATTLCCLMKKDVFEAVGGFHEELMASEDPEFRDRIRQQGLKTLVVRSAQVIHPPPASFQALWVRSQWYGIGEAMAHKLFKNESWRAINYRRPPWWGWSRLLFWWVGFFINPDKVANKSWPFTFQILRPLATLGQGLGYIKGLLTYRPKV